jgi:glycosyltransferase involved in cell wall biosynthesis
MVTNEVTAATFYRGYLSHLREQGWKVSIVASSNGTLDELGKLEGVAAHDLPMSRDPAPLADLASLIRAVRLLARLRPEVVVAATPKAGLLGMVAAWLTRVPVRIYFIWGLRLETEQGVRRFLFLLVEMLTARLATQVLSNSNSLADEVKQAGIAMEVAVIGAGSSHGVDVEYFDAARSDLPSVPVVVAQQLQLQDNAVTVGYVGRVHRDKGVGTLIEAAQSYARSGGRINLLVVGSTEDDALETRLAETVEHNLEIVRVQSVRDTRPFFLVMDIHCLPTLREGFPNVVLEAAALGIPTITTTATGARDSVVQGRTGILVDPSSPEQLVAAINTLARDPRLRNVMGERAQVRARELFSRKLVFSLQEGNLRSQRNARLDGNPHSRKWTESS